MRHTQTTKNNYFESHVQHLPRSPPSSSPSRRLLRRRLQLRSRRGKSIRRTYNNNIIYFIYYIYKFHNNKCGGGMHILYRRITCSGIGEIMRRI